MRLRIAALPAALSVLLLAACGKDDGPLPPLAYAPAETPYVVGSIEPIPEAVAERWLALSDDVLPTYSETLTQIITSMEAMPEGDADASSLALMRGLQAELAGKTSARELMQAWGLAINPRSALYGIELVPVMRAELADPAKFSSSLQRVVAAAGGELTQATLDGLDYWSYPLADAPLQLVIAIHAGQLVLTLAPKQVEDDLLRRLLGLELPRDNLLDDGALERLNERLGYSPYMTGYLDHARLFELLAQPNTGSQAAFLTALDYTPEPLSEACLAEGRALTKQWPRTALGATRFDASGYDFQMLLEAPKAVMDDLQTVLAPTPGLAEAATALMSFSFALKVDALPPLASKWAAAVQAQPWSCEAFAPLNEAFTEMRDGLQNPAVYAVGPSANAVHVLLTQFEMPDQGLDSGAMPTFEGKLLIGSPNPQGLVAMARNFVPQLSEFKLVTDAAPVALPTLPGAPEDLQLFGAVSASALGIAIGESQRDSLVSALVADAKGPQPLFQFGYDGAFYGRMMKHMMELSAPQSPGQPDMSAMFDMYEKTIKRLDAQVLLTPAGIEMISAYEIPDAR
jgi:hypothetical protein